MENCEAVTQPAPKPDNVAVIFLQSVNRTCGAEGRSQVMRGRELAGMSSPCRDRVCGVKASYDTGRSPEDFCQQAHARRRFPNIKIGMGLNIESLKSDERECRHQQRSLFPDQLLKDANYPRRSDPGETASDLVHRTVHHDCGAR